VAGVLLGFGSDRDIVSSETTVISRVSARAPSGDRNFQKTRSRAMADPVGQSFEIHIVGDETGETFTGKFFAKEKLSQADILAIDSRRRELLGPNGAEASNSIYNRATILAELAFRITGAPDWWKTSFNGLNIVDDNVVMEVHEKVVKVREDWLAAQKEKGEKARAALAAHQAAQQGKK
jgi:hypothetical protein